MWYLLVTEIFPIKTIRKLANVMMMLDNIGKTTMNNYLAMDSYLAMNNYLAMYN